MFTFTISGEPQGKARPRVTTRGTYTPKKTKDYERLVQWEFRSAVSVLPVLRGKYGRKVSECVLDK